MSVKKPNREELEKVLVLAQVLRDKGKDKFHLGHALLYLEERNRLLEDVRQKAEHYVRFGMGERELTALRLALEKLHDLDVEDADESSLFIRE